MTQDEILAKVTSSEEIFRNCFYDLLGQLSKFAGGFPSEKDWNSAYETTCSFVDTYRITRG
jgi:hypothetical protein